MPNSVYFKHWVMNRSITFLLMQPSLTNYALQFGAFKTILTLLSRDLSGSPALALRNPNSCLISFFLGKRTELSRDYIIDRCV